MGQLASSTRELKKNARRRSILDAARSLILEGTNKDFSMPDLAEKAGVSLVTPYNLFGSKSSILLEIVREDIYDRAQDIADLPCEDLVGWISELSRILSRVYYSKRHFYRRMIVTLVAQESAEGQRDSLMLTYRMFEAALERPQLLGKFRPVISTATLARHLAHSVAGSLQDRLMERGTEQKLAVEIETGVLLMLSGICTPNEQSGLLRRLEALGTGVA